MKRLILLVSAACVAGCTTWGSNINGNFSCKAPKGSCLPTAEIDARAVDHLEQFRPNDTDRVRLVVRKAVGINEGQELRRSGERVLRIRFMPRIDEAGHFHEAYTVHAVVEGSGWVEMPPRPGGGAVEAKGAAGASGEPKRPYESVPVVETPLPKPEGVGGGLQHDGAAAVEERRP